MLKNADELSFAEIEKQIKLISEKAKHGKQQLRIFKVELLQQAMEVYGSMLSTPILNLLNLVC